MNGKPIIALMYDFDMTLSPRDMQEYAFIPGLGMEAKDFWRLCAEAAEKHNMDSILAYMFVMIREAKGRMPLTRDLFRAQGQKVELFPGVLSWFDRVNAYAAQKDFTIEHYILSSGVKEIIEGTPIANRFERIYAGEFVYNEQGEPIWPAMAVNFTSKTQFIYRINKGILNITEIARLNARTPHDERHIPYRNMIYIGDGLTDVPCMKLVKTRGGYAIAVYQGERNEMVNRMLIDERVNYATPADYSQDGLLETIVFSLIDSIAADVKASAISHRQLREAQSGLRIMPKDEG